MINERLLTIVNKLLDKRQRLYVVFDFRDYNNILHKELRQMLQALKALNNDAISIYGFREVGKLYNLELKEFYSNDALTGASALILVSDLGMGKFYTDPVPEWQNWIHKIQKNDIDITVFTPIKLAANNLCCCKVESWDNRIITENEIELFLNLLSLSFYIDFDLIRGLRLTVTPWLSIGIELVAVRSLVMNYYCNNVIEFAERMQLNYLQTAKDYLPLVKLTRIFLQEYRRNNKAFFTAFIEDLLYYMVDDTEENKIKLKKLLASFELMLSDIHLQNTTFPNMIIEAQYILEALQVDNPIVDQLSNKAFKILQGAL